MSQKMNEFGYLETPHNERPSVFRKPRLERHGDLWYLIDNSISGSGPSPADAAAAFDRAWLSGKSEVTPPSTRRETTPF